MEWLETLQFANNLSAVIILPIVIGVVISRILAHQKLTGNWNWSRTILLGAFISSYISRILIFLQYDLYLTLFPNEYLASNIYSIGINTIFDVLTVVLSIVFILYVNKRDYFVLTPLFLYIGALWFYFRLGIGGFNIIFLIGGIIALIFIFQTGLSLRDNNVFALGIMYTCLLLGFMLPYSVISIVIETIGWYFGLTIAFEKFHLFKEDQ